MKIGAAPMPRQEVMHTGPTNKGRHTAAGVTTAEQFRKRGSARSYDGTRHASCFDKLLDKLLHSRIESYLSGSRPRPHTASGKASGQSSTKAMACMGAGRITGREMEREGEGVCLRRLSDDLGRSVACMLACLRVK